MVYHMADVTYLSSYQLLILTISTIFLKQNFVENGAQLLQVHLNSLHHGQIP
jgi:hypothetical protein